MRRFRCARRLQILDLASHQLSTVQNLDWNLEEDQVTGQGVKRFQGGPAISV